MTIRQQRLTELLFEELSIMVGNELDDPRLSLVRVTSVETSRDLRHAKVFVNHDNPNVSKDAVLYALKRAAPHLRSEIAVRCTLRVAPELFFHYDDLPEKAARVDDLLREIAAERARSEQTSDTYPPD